MTLNGVRYYDLLHTFREKRRFKNTVPEINLYYINGENLSLVKSFHLGRLNSFCTLQNSRLRHRIR